MPQAKTAKTSAKYLGDGSEYFSGVPARDLSEDDFAGLPDEQKALLAAEPPHGVKRLYSLHQAAAAEAEQAVQRLGQADTTEPADAPAATKRPAATPARA